MSLADQKEAMFGTTGAPMNELSSEFKDILSFPSVTRLASFYRNFINVKKKLVPRIALSILG